MKKALSLIILSLLLTTISYPALAKTKTIVPKAPIMTETIKPAIIKFKNGNYIGSIQDLKVLLKKEKHNVLAKYYMALCYTKLGFREEAEIYYKDVINEDKNLILSHYSEQALTCLNNPNNVICKPKTKEEIEASKNLTDMDKFIESGQRFHPSAMDRITKERMDRKLQEEEYLRRQRELNRNNLNLSNNAPTNEEIKNAFNTLAKIGINPYSQYNNPLAQAQQFNQLGAMGITSQQNMYGAFLNGNTNNEVARMFLYNQMTQPQNNMMNNMMNYGI